LLPGSSSAAALITSRARLVGLEGAQLVTLDVLTGEQAFELLSTVAGTERFTGEPDAGRAIAELCGHLPLAIRIAACRLAARPHWRPQELAGRLAHSRSRLDELTQGDLEVRTTLAVSYDTLDPTTRMAFRRLGLIDAPTFPSWVVAAALDQPIEGVDELMERLADARLLEVAGYDHAGQLRYRFHDLLRLFARERAAAEEAEADRMRVIERALGGWLASAQAASATIPRTFPGHPLAAPTWQVALEATGPLISDGYAWFDSEWPALVAVTEQACDLGLAELAAGLASTASAFLHAKGYLDEWRHVHERALATAQGAGHRVARSLLLCDLGEVHCIQDRMGEARACFVEAERLAREAGDRTREALVNSSLGYLLRLQSDYEEALERYQRALTIAREVDNLVVQAHATQGLGNIHFDQGRIDDAALCFADALTLAREARFVECVVRALRGLAMVERHNGELDNAIGHVQQAIRELGVHQNPLGEAHASLDLAGLYVDAGRFAEGRTLYEQRLPIFGEQSDRFGTALTRRGLGLLYTEEGRYDQARHELEESARIFAELELPLWQARALDGLSRVLAVAGEPDRAAEVADTARALAEKAGGSVD
jgi:tetratricopeptide (TPR) repeat protein